MASREEQELIELINLRLDGEELVRAIGYHTEKTRKLGNSLKTPCFVHGDDKFATLIVMPDKRTYKCMVNTCRANTEGTLVHLYALWKNVDDLKAALEAAELTGVELSGATFEAFLERWLTEARRLESEGDTESARALYTRAARLAPRNTNVVLCAAKACETIGDTEQAVSMFLLGAKAAKRAGKTEDALRILQEEALRLSPDRLDVMEELAELLAESGSAEQGAEVLAAAAENATDTESAATLIERAVGLAPDSLSIQLRRADLIAREGEATRATEIMVNIAQQAMEKGEPLVACTALRGALNADPGRSDLIDPLIEAAGKAGNLEEIASYLENLAEHHDENPDLLLAAAKSLGKAGQNESARPLVQRAIDTLSTRDDTDAIRNLYEDLTAEKSDGGYWLEQFGEWLAARGEIQAAIGRFQARVDSLADSEDAREESVRLLQRMVEIDDFAPEIRRSLALARVSAGQDVEAGRDFEEASRLLSEQQRHAESLEVLEEMALSVSACESGLGKLIEQAREMDEKEGAALRLGRIARQRQERGLEPGNIGILEQVIDLLPDDESAREQLAKAHEESGDKSAAVESWRELAVKRMCAEEFAGAVAAIDEAIRLEPTHLEVRMERLDILDAMGDDDVYRTEALAFLKRTSAESAKPLATKVIRRLGEKFPEDSSFVERLAEIEIDGGDVESGTKRLRLLAESMIAAENVEDATRVMRKLLDARPDDREVRDKLLKFLEDSGQTKDLLSTLLSLAQAHFARGDQAAALDCISTYESHASGQWELLKHSCEIMAGHDLQDRAISTIRSLAKSGTVSADDLVAACEYGLSIAPEDRGLAERLLSLYSEQGEPEKELRVGLMLAAILENECDRKAMMATLESLKQKCPSAREPRLELARIHEKSSRKDKAKAELASLANQLRAESNKSEARDLYKRAIALDPQDLEIGLEYADCLVELNERDDAIAEVRRLAAMAMESGKHDKAGDLYGKLMELAPEDLEARGDYVTFLTEHGDIARAAEEALGLAHRWFRTGQPGKAIEWSHKACSYVPDSRETIIEAADLLQQNGYEDEGVELLAKLAGRQLELGEHDAAAEVLRDALVRNPQQPTLLAASAELSLAGGDKGQALATLRKLAAVHDSAGRLPECEEIWRQVLELEPESIADHEELISVLQRQGPGRRQETLEALRRLNGFYLSNGLRADAITCLQRQLEIDPALPEVREELAHAFFEEGRYKEATEQFLLLADAYRLAGKQKLAIDYLGKVIELDPQNTYALNAQVDLTLSEGRLEEFADYSLRLASLQESSGSLDDAIATVRAIVDADRENLDVRPILASYLIKAGDTSESLSIYLGTARRHIAAKKFPKAVEVLDRARSLQDLEAGKLEELGELYLAAAERQTALSILRAAAEKFRNASDVQALERISERLLPMLTEEKKLDEVLEWQFDLARLQIGLGMIEQARSLMERVSQERPGDRTLHEIAGAMWAESGIPELAANEHIKIARLCMDQQDWHEARAWCRKAIEGRPREVLGREMLGECLNKLGEVDEACTVLTEVVGLYEDSLQTAQAADVLGRIVEMQPEAPAHLERLADALQKLGRHDELAGTLRVLAQVFEKREEYEKAIESLRRLKSMRPDDTRVRSSFIRLHRQLGREKVILEDLVHLATLHAKRGDRAAAVATLHEAAGLDPFRPEAREHLLGMHLENDETEAAVETALELVDVYIRLTAFREAAIALQRVKRLAGDDPRYRLAQANIHMAQNARGMALREYEEASRLFMAKGDMAGRTSTIARIIEIDPQNLEVRRELIECLLIQDKVAAATEAQRQLAEAYANRGLWDLAENEYRSIVSIDSSDLGAWQSLFAAHLEIGDERDLVPDYISVARTVLEKGDVNEALHYLGRAVSLDTHNIEARELYIEAYKQVGKQSELCDDYLRLADLYVEAGRIDEGIAMYNHLMTIDPGNTVVRERLSETQARFNKLDKTPAEQKRARKRKSRKPNEASTPDPGDSMKSAPAKAREGAADFLADEIESLDNDDRDEALAQVISSYRDILSINPQNANVRIKLAELYMQQKEREKALEELRAASETLLLKGELALCISVCEKILKMAPTDQKIRNRLRQAFNKRDAFKALESAILYSDGDKDKGASNEERPPGAPRKR